MKCFGADNRKLAPKDTGHKIDRWTIAEGNAIRLVVHLKSLTQRTELLLEGRENYCSGGATFAQLTSAARRSGRIDEPKACHCERRSPLEGRPSKDLHGEIED